MRLFICSFMAAVSISTLSARADPPAVHGMLLFGSETLYVSHLPMFHTPHDYQLIAEVRFAANSTPETIEAYQELKDSGEEMFTIAPNPMDLTRVISGQKTSFGAHLFHGHFERDGTFIGIVKLDIETIVYAKKLDPEQEPTDFSKFLVFGKSPEYYGAHLIQARPSMDAIVKVSAPVAVSCRTRLCRSPQDPELPITLIRLASRSELTVESGQTLGLDVQSIIEDIIYVETGDLEH